MTQPETAPTRPTRCKKCGGRGSRDCDDPQCGDSTWDHFCNDGAPCHSCGGKSFASQMDEYVAALEASLATSSERERALELSLNTQNGNVLTLHRELESLRASLATAQRDSERLDAIERGGGLVLTPGANGRIRIVSNNRADWYITDECSFRECIDAASRGTSLEPESGT